MNIQYFIETNSKILEFKHTYGLAQSSSTCTYTGIISCKCKNADRLDCVCRNKTILNKKENHFVDCCLDLYKYKKNS